MRFLLGFACLLALLPALLAAAITLISEQIRPLIEDLLGAGSQLRFRSHRQGA